MLGVVLDITERVQATQLAERFFSLPLHLLLVAESDNGQIYAIAHDITERREAEQALRRSRQLYRSLTEVSPVGVFHANRRDISCM